MIFDLINLNGYGLYVWPSFLFTLITCCILYIRTVKEFKKSEKIFLEEFGQFEITQVKTQEEIKNGKPALYNFFYS